MGKENISPTATPSSLTQPHHPLHNIQPTTSGILTANPIVPKKRGRQIGSFGVKRRREMEENEEKSKRWKIQ